MKRPIFVIAFLLGAILILSLVQVVVSNRIATNGLALGTLEDTIASYQKENTLLSEKLLFASSYTHIASAAAKMGFVDNKKTVYVTTSQTIALRP